MGHHKRETERERAGERETQGERRLPYRIVVLTTPLHEVVHTRPRGTWIVRHRQHGKSCVILILLVRIAGWAAAARFLKGNPVRLALFPVALNSDFQCDRGFPATAFPYPHTSLPASKMWKQECCYKFRDTWGHIQGRNRTCSYTVVYSTLCVKTVKTNVNVVNPLVCPGTGLNLWDIYLYK